MIAVFFFPLCLLIMSHDKPKNVKSASLQKNCFFSEASLHLAQRTLRKLELRDLVYISRVAVGNFPLLVGF